MSHPTNTPVTFSREELRFIRDLMSMPRARILCPRCGGTLVLVGPIDEAAGQGAMFEITCRPCHRSAIVTEPSGFRRPEA